MVSLLTLPLTVGCTLISLGCTFITGVLTTANGVIFVVNLTFCTVQGAWILTKITYTGTMKVAEISITSIKMAATLFSSNKELPHIIMQNHVVNEELTALFASTLEQLTKKIKESESACESWLEEAVIIPTERELSDSLSAEEIQQNET